MGIAPRFPPVSLVN